MCGIVGLLGGHVPDYDPGSVIPPACVRALNHRGPDSWGVWRDPNAGVFLAHTRLAILDVSPAGAQPMHSASGRYVIVFNGEIYNFAQLRDELDLRGRTTPWRGHSDTEVLLAAVEAWGLAEALTRVVGMFAFAIWDAQERCLQLVRDRMGEKPLYYGWIGGAFAFASELKALRALPGFVDEIDRRALASFIRYSYVPAPHSIHRGIYKLPPGTWASIEVADLPRQTLPKPQEYWSALAAAIDGHANPLEFDSDSAVVSALEDGLRQSIRGQMVADVPLGAFLSGGIDSSVIVALMQAEAADAGVPRVKTFSIGFQNAAYNEAKHANAVAKHLGTDHTELYVTPSEALAAVPRIPQLYDEPFADSSQIPTFLVALMAREKVAVALSGDAGDELFGGYNRHLIAADAWKRVLRVAPAVRALAGRAIRSASPEALNRIFDCLTPLLPKRYRLSLPGDKLHKAAELLQHNDGRALYRGLVSQWDPTDVMLSPTDLERESERTWPPLPSLAEQMMFMDLVTYLPDDILVKVDRAAMGVSLESRVPFLDHRVVEFALRLPMRYKIRDGVGKWILREVLRRHVPRSLVERPKMGFAIPLDEWLRGPLRAWAEDLLAPHRLAREGFFQIKPVRMKWDEHLSGRRNWQHHLWNILMFQAWHEHWYGT